MNFSLDCLNIQIFSSHSQINFLESISYINYIRQLWWVSFIKNFICLNSVIYNLWETCNCIRWIIIIISSRYLDFCFIYFICIILIGYKEIYFYFRGSWTYFSLWCSYDSSLIGNGILSSNSLNNLLNFFLWFSQVNFLLKLIIRLWCDNLCCFSNIHNLWINWLITGCILTLDLTNNCLNGFLISIFNSYKIS